MPRKYKAEQSSGQTVLLVDDDAEYLEATGLLLEREGHRVLLATNGPAALDLLRENQIDVLLLDYFMPGMTGEQVVVKLRQFNPYVQIILQTGYASEKPPRELLKRLDIQGYFDKSEGPDKLLLWTEVGLKAAFAFQLLYKSRQGLRYILDVTPDLHKIQPLSDLFQGILLQVCGLLGAVNSFLAVLPEAVAQPADVETEGFLAMVEEDDALVLRAGTGRFAAQPKINGLLNPEKLEFVGNTLRQSEIQIGEGSTAVPLRIGDLTLGVIYLDRAAVQERDKELLHIFANQAAVAIHNAELHEMAALDSLTGVFNRRVFDQSTLRELRTAFRSQQPVGLLMIDMDNLKKINDDAGHPMGDQALMMLAKVLRRATRANDIIGRYGGDEFSVTLPQTSENGAEQVAQRILDLLGQVSLPCADSEVGVTVSMGLGILQPHAFAPGTIPHPTPQAYFEAMAQALVGAADAVLYRAKHSGGNQVCKAPAIEWQPLPVDSVADE